MARKKFGTENEIELTRTTRTLYFFVGIFALSIIIFDAGNLLTQEAVINRWMLVSALFTINTIAWFLAAQAAPGIKLLLTYILAGSSLCFAGFMTYWERGMASSSTLFYILPLLVIATLKNRHALMATSALAMATYAFAAVKYFNDYFNEGYRVQLWGNIVMYGGSIFALTWLILILAGLRQDSK